MGFRHLLFHSDFPSRRNVLRDASIDHSDRISNISRILKIPNDSEHISLSVDRCSASVSSWRKNYRPRNASFEYERKKKDNIPVVT